MRSNIKTFLQFVNESLNEGVSLDNMTVGRHPDKGNKYQADNAKFEKYALKEAVKNTLGKKLSNAKEIDPKDGPKTNGTVIYTVTQKKQNPYTSNSELKTIQPNTIIACFNGKQPWFIERVYGPKGSDVFKNSKFKLVKELGDVKYFKSPTKDDPDEGGTNGMIDYFPIGMQEQKGGKNSSGLKGINRIVELADTAYVL